MFAENSDVAFGSRWCVATEFGRFEAELCQTLHDLDGGRHPFDDRHLEFLTQPMRQVDHSRTPQHYRFRFVYLERGVYLAPASYEAGFVSAAHDQKVIAATLAAVDDALGALARV